MAVLIARDRTNREIAAELGISVRTADAHVRTILAKLGLASRIEVPLTPGPGDESSPGCPPRPALTGADQVAGP